ncbi:Amino acid transporter [Candidatus Koribacter versatilis Ellin345]|uniref:Amino acid transporter n=1 Tax=Koribacter versatilis (strain Ellin345) TaxID=204669 RepID=Q1IVD3_KORVE|nr:APC family permease [Candidatus Koribacter versatilis]ABF39167.1 Amino acid transporter [Candidatus Koribacter versatilis Ellin345]
MSSFSDQANRPAVKVFVATTVMLSFISFWRAAAIVLSDLASSAYYVGGDAEKVIGKSAPWFVLAVMLFANGVRAVYIESSVMFVRGGVYKVVKSAMGSQLAKLSVSALLFDYVLTGPISGVSAGQYLAGLLIDTLGHFGHPIHATDQQINYFAAVVAICVSLYFWWNNIKGIHESSDKALRIMQITSIMVVLLIGWCLITFILHPETAHLPPFPSRETLKVSGESLGWLYGTWAGKLLPILLIVGFGHSVLAMSGEESLGQVNREIEHPKLQNLIKAGIVIACFALFFTSLVSIFAVMIIPDSVRPNYFANLISGLAMNVAGPYTLRLFFQAFVVLVGALLLSGAVNTAIVGANGVLNRLSEDGVLTSWFRHPHPRFGTSHRVINMIVILQIGTIIASRGNVYLLAALYAFGVVWSFSFMSLAVLVLRFKNPENRQWKVPGNIRFGQVEFPITVSVIFLALLSVAIVNLFTKPLATKYGIIFSALLYGVFTVTERMNQRTVASGKHELEQFRVAAQEEPSYESIEVRPGNILVAVRDPKNLTYLRKILQETDTTKRDVVVMTARVYHRQHSFGDVRSMEPTEVFDQYEQSLFTAVVNIAEKEGKHISLLVAPTNDVFDAILATAQRLRSSKIVCGLSNKLSDDEQAKLSGDAWERLPEPRPRLRLVIVAPDGREREYELGPHNPRLRLQDLKLMHEIWLELTRDPKYSGLHHYHVVGAALKELQDRLHGTDRVGAIRDIEAEIKRDSDEPPQIVG